MLATASCDTEFTNRCQTSMALLLLVYFIWHRTTTHYIPMGGLETASFDTDIPATFRRCKRESWQPHLVTQISPMDLTNAWTNPYVFHWKIHVLETAIEDINGSANSIDKSMDVTNLLSKTIRFYKSIEHQWESIKLNEKQSKSITNQWRRYAHRWDPKHKFVSPYRYLFRILIEIPVESS